MNINYELYRIFYYVASLGNITLASNKLNISQPAVSKAIKNLEEQLGGKLFVRSQRGVKLTSEGEEFYFYIKQAIEFIMSAENKFNELINLETGTIKIGISSILTKKFLSPYLEKFHNKYPKIEIQIISAVTSELVTQLKNGLLDMVVTIVDDNCKFDDVILKKIKKIHDCFIVRGNYFNLLDKEISIKELNNYPLILQNNETSSRNFLNDIIKKYDMELVPDMELASFSLVVEFVKIGYGIGFATKEFIKDEIDNNILAELKIKEDIPDRYISIIVSKKHLSNFSTKKLIEIIDNK